MVSHGKGSWAGNGHNKQVSFKHALQRKVAAILFATDTLAVAGVVVLVASTSSSNESGAAAAESAASDDTGGGTSLFSRKINMPHLRLPHNLKFGLVFL